MIHVDARPFVRPKGRILHVSEYCYLDSTGGVQRYLAELLREMQLRGLHSSLMWLTDERTAARQSADHSVVVAMPSRGPDDGSADFRRAAERALLHASRPALIHFHTFGQREAVIAELAAQHSIPYLFTYHYPASLCPNRSLLRWGTTPCDGEIRALRCSACRLVSVVRTPRAPGAAAHQFAGSVAASARRAPAVFRRPAMAAWRDAVRHFLTHSVLVLFHVPRARPILEANGAQPATLHLCPPGVSADFLRWSGRPATPAPGDRSAPFVVGYVGRLDPLKGFGILVEGFMRTTWPKARLRLVGSSGPHGRDVEYVRRIEQLAGHDSRVQFVGGLPLGANASLYDRMALLAIPSVGVEGGPPLVLYEALQLGLPVLGSNQVGEPELVSRYGHLVDPNTPEKWAEVLSDVFDKIQRGQQWTANVNGADRLPRRTMADAALDIIGHYERIVGPA